MKHLKEFDSIGKLYKYYESDKFITPNVYTTTNNEVDINDEYEIICFFDTTNDLSGSADLLTSYDKTSLESYTVDGVKHSGDDLPLNKSSLTPGKHIIKLKYKNKTVFGNTNNSPVFYNRYLKKVFIPSGIETLCTNLFNSANGIEELKIPKTVKQLSNYNSPILTNSQIKFLDLSETNNEVFIQLMKASSSCSIDELLCPDIKTLENNLFSSGSKYIKKINLGKSLKTIESGAFSNNTYIEEIIMPNTVTSIGASCFNYCSGLKKINISDSLTKISNSTFAYCKNLEEINIPNSVTSIGSYAFESCSNLEKINISNNSLLTSIGSYAFNSCISLIELNIPNSVTIIGDYALNSTKVSNINITNNLISIGNYAFVVNYSTKINLYLDNSSVTNLGNVLNPSTIKKLEIGSHAIDQNGELYLTSLNGYPSLENIIFPEGLTKMPSLSGNLLLKTFNVPTTVTSITSDFVSSCNNLEDSYIENGIRYIDINNFGTYIVNITDFTLQHYTIKTGVVVIIPIFNSALTNIQSITLPESLINILDGSFNYLYDNDILTSQQVDFILNINPNAISEINKLLKKPNSYFEDKYFSIYSIGNGSISFDFVDASTSNESENYKELEYSFDNGENWYSINNIGTGNSKTGAISKQIYVNFGNTVLFKGNINPIDSRSVYVNSAYRDVGGIGKFSATIEFYVFGNVMSLLYGDNFINQKSLENKNYVFMNLFNCEMLGTFYKTKLLNANKLVLPATTLSNYCYRNMFKECKGLMKVPELPATALTQFCYLNMFDGCSSLTSAPELPATTLANYCYQYMFNNCTSLTTTPELPVTTLADYCYSNMFKGCTSLTEAPELPATTLTRYCYLNMFDGCSSLTSAPNLPATTLAQSCYNNMFQNCTSLTTAPKLPATTLAQSCYYNMFKGCTSLTTAPELPATTLTQSCYNSMFSGCTSLTESPILPATTLVNQCYQYMFYGCENLSKITMLATSISGDVWYSWVSGISPTGTFIKAPGVSIPTANANSYYKGIPEGWTVQDYVTS